MAEKNVKPAYKFIVKFHGVSAWFSGDASAPLASLDDAKRFNTPLEAHEAALPHIRDGYCIEPVVR